MLRTVALAIAVIMTASVPASASYLCVGDKATGYQWNGDSWNLTAFKTYSHIVREVSSEDEIAAECYSGLGSHGFINNDSLDGIDTKEACYAIYEVGSKPSQWDVAVCRQLLKDGDLVQIVCSIAAENFSMVPQGEFVYLQNASIPLANDRLKHGIRQRDPVVMEIGKCSPID